MLNRDLHKGITDMIQTLGREKNLTVMFWGVDRGHNQDADRLANAALDTTPFGIIVSLTRITLKTLTILPTPADRICLKHRRMGHVPLGTLKPAVGRSRGSMLRKS